jgi:hypothetical protein
MNEFFGNSTPGLTTAMLAFHTTIMMLSEVYPWYGCILNLAIEYYQWIAEAEQGPTTVEYWRLPVIAVICTSNQPGLAFRVVSRYTLLLSHAPMYPGRPKTEHNPTIRASGQYEPLLSTFSITIHA